MRRLFASTAIALVLLAARDANADDDALRLTWTAPAGCPSTEDVRSATLRGADRRAAKAGVLEAEARVEQRASSWKVRLRTRRGAATGEREIEATTCSGVADATAVVLALALVPQFSGPFGLSDTPAADPPGSAPEPKPTALPASPEREATFEGPVNQTTRAPEGRAGRGSNGGSHALALGASVAGDASTLPSAAVGGSLTLAWTPARVRVELDARRWASQSQTLSASDAGARFSMTSLGGRGCFAALRGGSLDLSPCAGGDVHLVSAPGYGADANYSASAQWVTVAGGGLARVSMTSWLALRARVEAFVPLARPTFVVENEGTVHRPPTLGAAASLGVEVLFL